MIVSKSTRITGGPAVEVRESGDAGFGRSHFGIDQTAIVLSKEHDLFGITVRFVFLDQCKVGHTRLASN